MQDPLIIVGIDPGTTVGYAALDLDGRLLKLRSSKGLSPSLLIREVAGIGIPVAVGTDKAAAPRLVVEFAAKTGCRLVRPGSDLAVREKRLACRGLKTQNDHELDALASALFAYRRTKGLIGKLRRFIKKNRQDEAGYELMKLVLLNESLSIKRAQELVWQGRSAKTGARDTAHRKAQAKEEHRSAFHEKKDREESQIRMLKSRLADSESKVRSLSSKADALACECRSKGRQVQKLKKRLGKEEKSIRAGSVFARKSEQIQLLKKRLAESEKRQSDQGDILQRLGNVLENLDDYAYVKRLENLGEAAFRKAKVSYGDVIMVQDASVTGRGVLEELKKRVRLVIAAKPSRPLGAMFSVMTPESVGLVCIGRFCFCRKNKLEQADGRAILGRLIDEYRGKR